MDWEEVTDNIATTMMDAIEDCVGSMVLAKGKKLFSVVIVNAVFVGVAVLMWLLELPSFVSIPEALAGLVLSVVIALSNAANRKSVESFAKSIKQKG